VGTEGIRRAGPSPWLGSFRELGSVVSRNRQLLWELSRREITDRYAGQAFGPLWAVLHPLLLIAVYLFVFAFVFKIRVARSDGLPLNYAVYLLSGLVPWLFVQEALNRSAVALSANANLVKQVVFPVEILPLRSVVASLVPVGVSLALLLLYCGVGLGAVPGTWLLVPLLLVVLATGLAGLGFVAAAVGCYLRDLKDLVQAFTVMGIYLIPAFYLPDMVPPLFRPLLYVNPFSYVVWCFQDAIYFGRIEHPFAWVVLPLLSLAALVGGYRLFQRLKVQFGNVL